MDRRSQGVAKPASHALFDLIAGQSATVFETILEGDVSALRSWALNELPNEQDTYACSPAQVKQG